MQARTNPRRYWRTRNSIKHNQSLADWIFGDLFQDLEQTLVVFTLVLIMVWAVTQ